MSRFKRLSHVIWCCEYHLVWVPKYRFRVLQGPIAAEIYKTLQVYCGRLNCEVVELNVQPDHVHLLVKVPPKLSISSLMGTLKGKTAIQIFRQFPDLKKRPYWGNHFWAKGYCKRKKCVRVHLNFNLSGDDKRCLLRGQRNRPPSRGR